MRHFRKPSLCSRVRDGICQTHELHSSFCSHSACLFKVICYSSRLLRCEWHPPWPYILEAQCQLHHITERGQSPNASLVMRWEIPSRCHICQGVILSVIWRKAVLSLIPFPSSSPKKILLPQVSHELSQSDSHQLNQFPRVLPSTLTEGSNT